LANWEITALGSEMKCRSSNVRIDLVNKCPFIF
jgi:hypothetical protein